MNNQYNYEGGNPHAQHHNTQSHAHHAQPHAHHTAAEGTDVFGGLEDGNEYSEGGYSGGNVIYDWKHGRPLYALIEGAVIVLLLFCLMYSVFGSAPSGWLVALSLVAAGLYLVVELVPNLNSKTDEWNAALSAKLSH